MKNHERLARRDALKVLASGAVGAVTSSAWVDSLCAFAHQQAHSHAAQAAVAAQGWTPRVLTARQDATVAALCELIIPETDTPGARAVGVNRFVDSVLHDAPDAERTAFLRGLAWIEERSRTRFKKDFVDLAAADQTSLLSAVADRSSRAAADRVGVDFFRAIKSMTIDGYYTTESGLRRELGVTGQLFLIEFDGCKHAEHQ
jgi:hypothetical protein